MEDESSAARIACRQALDMAGVGLGDIDACELYDCFTYTVESTLRDYGFFRPEEVREWLTADRIGPGGELPVNTSGGMLSESLAHRCTVRACFRQLFQNPRVSSVTRGE